MHIITNEKLTFTIQQETINQLKQQYNALNVEEELNRIQVHCKANVNYPDRLPSLSTVNDFIIKWLDKRSTGVQQQTIRQPQVQPFKTKRNQFTNYRNQQTYDKMDIDEESLLANSIYKTPQYPISDYPPVSDVNRYGHIGADLYILLEGGEKYIPSEQLVRRLQDKYYPVDIVRELYVMMDYYKKLENNDEGKWSIEGSIRIWLERKQKQIIKQIKSAQDSATNTVTGQ